MLEPREIILDLFAGSGSTLLAAERTGRRARIIEIDPYYLDIAIRRWQTLTGKLATNAATGRSFAEAELAAEAELREVGSPIEGEAP